LHHTIHFGWRGEKDGKGGVSAATGLNNFISSLDSSFWRIFCLIIIFKKCNAYDETYLSVVFPAAGCCVGMPGATLKTGGGLPETD
jgi:hypothetical protein